MTVTNVWFAHRAVGIAAVASAWARDIIDDADAAAAPATIERFVGEIRQRLDWIEQRALKSRSWRDVLEFQPLEPVTADMVAARFARLATIRHPAAPGGSHATADELDAARRQALLELEASQGDRT